MPHVFSTNKVSKEYHKQMYIIYLYNIIIEAMLQ